MLRMEILHGIPVRLVMSKHLFKFKLVLSSSFLSRNLVDFVLNLIKVLFLETIVKIALEEIAISLDFTILRYENGRMLIELTTILRISNIFKIMYDLIKYVAPLIFVVAWCY